MNAAATQRAAASSYLQTQLLYSIPKHLVLAVFVLCCWPVLLVMILPLLTLNLQSTWAKTLHSLLDVLVIRWIFLPYDVIRIVRAYLNEPRTVLRDADMYKLSMLAAMLHNRKAWRGD